MLIIISFLMSTKTGSPCAHLHRSSEPVLLFIHPSCDTCSGHRHSEGEALGRETENLLQIKQFSILRFSKGAVFSSMYVTAHLIDFITIIQGRGGIFKPRHSVSQSDMLSLGLISTNFANRYVVVGYFPTTPKVSISSLARV